METINENIFFFKREFSFGMSYSSWMSNNLIESSTKWTVSVDESGKSLMKTFMRNCTVLSQSRIGTPHGHQHQSEWSETILEVFWTNMDLWSVLDRPLWLTDLPHWTQLIGACSLIKSILTFFYRGFRIIPRKST